MRRGPKTDNARPEVQSVRRAIQLLRAFSPEQPELGVNELARAHGLHPSSVSRLLGTLADNGFVRLNPETGRYRLGFAVLELAGLVLRDLDARAAARPVMRELARRSQETVNLAVPDGCEAVIVEQAVGDGVFRYVSWVGRRVPLHATAHGKVLLAFQPPERRRELLQALADAQGQLPAFTPSTVRSPSALEAELALVAVRGYATARGELYPPTAAVAVPIFDHTGGVVASLALPGPIERYTPERVETVAALALEAGRQISADLGWRAADAATATRPADGAVAAMGLSVIGPGVPAADPAVPAAGGAPAASVDSPTTARRLGSA